MLGHLLFHCHGERRGAKETPSNLKTGVMPSIGGQHLTPRWMPAGLLPAEWSTVGVGVRDGNRASCLLPTQNSVAGKVLTRPAKALGEGGSVSSGKLSFQHLTEKDVCSPRVRQH